jgi:hypothetical protein
MKRAMVLLAAFGLLAVTASAESVINLNGGPLSLTFTGETGFVKVLTHEITVGDPDLGNTTFNYVTEGGQEILFPFNRLTTELGIGDRHTVIFLYQPLSVVTQVRLESDETIDGVLFSADEGINVTYGFPFYRTSYLFDFFAQDNIELSAGISFQLRNASLRFESTDGESVVVTQDLGLVPIIKLRGEYEFTDSVIPGAFVGMEADGFYATSAFFNGAEYDFSGSIFDASLRAGFEPMPGFDVFLNLRGLGGGANGTRGSAREFATQSRDGYTDNFLTTMSVSIGARLQ